MHGTPTADLDRRESFDGPGHEVLEPVPCQRLPVVVASPHSGDRYPAAFIAASRLDPLTLRRSEDCFVDEMFSGVPAMGAPLIRALFPRAYVDVNREPFELDPAMFVDRLPPYVTTRSPRIAAGLGTIPRVVASGHDIYGSPLTFAEASSRIRTLHRPYHEHLARLVAETRRRFGVCLLIDAHSMPSAGALGDWDGPTRLDMVLGDCHGTACDPAIVTAVERSLAERGYGVARNDPYPGGFTTRHYGRPRDRVYALQIEINRALYMDEERMQRRPGLDRLAADMTALVSELGRFVLERYGAA